ncbi:MAG: glycosyltransferase, partial [Solobacterium sp.]|nr:glycosyltransferase [Solobacterium sp.]
MKPILYIVIPCYNEEKVLPITSDMFLKKIESLIQNKKIAEESSILFVNDGSKDSTWEIIHNLAEENKHYKGICLSRNRGHQN